MESVYLVSGARTPFGNFGGALKDLHPIQLGCEAGRAALTRGNVAPDQIEEVFFGNVLPADSRSVYLARHIGLELGIPKSAAALTLNRLCGSGMEAVGQACMAIQTGRVQVALAGGTENMSQTPYIASGARFGNRLGNAQLLDLLLEGLTDAYVDLPMGGTAENLADRYKISREEQDEWALISQTRAEAARDSGRLAEEIVAVEIRSRKETIKVEHDEFIRGKEKSSRLADLRPAFKKDGSVTAANASGINDGASATVIAGEAALKSNNLKPMARIVSWAVSGCDPEIMGIGPAHAIPRALDRGGLKLSDMDLIEVNEAFAAQYLSVQKELDLDSEKTNVNGGAIAIGHPLGASGNRVLLTLCYELKRRKLKYGVASLCIGGGQGIAMVVENVSG